MRLLVVAALAGALVGCTDAVPCQNCPRIEGTYSVRWADAGTSDGGCPAVGPRPATLAFTQSQSRLTTEVGDVPLGGTIYDTYDFALTGSGSGVSYAMRAIAIPTGTSVDGGMKLDGALTTRTTQGSGEPCEVREGFVAERQR